MSTSTTNFDIRGNTYTNMSPQYHNLSIKFERTEGTSNHEHT